MTIETLLTLKTLVALGAFAVFACWERLWPADARPLLLTFKNHSAAAARRLGRNVGLFGINLLISPLIVLPITAWATSNGLGWRPAWTGGVAGLLLDVLILDFWIYWWHRANHEIPFLWRFHEVHHLDEHLDTSSGVRFHAGEVALSALVRAALIVALGIPFASVVVFETLVLATALFHHSDAKLPDLLERTLSKVIVTPGIHWVHHHARRADTDSNYGTIFSFWDRMFGSKSRTARYAGMPIGVENLRERALLGLVLRPFRRRRRPPAAPLDLKSRREEQV